MANLQNSEVWRDIPFFEGYYQCSNTGKVKSLRREVIHPKGNYFTTERVLKATKTKNGYMIVTLSVRGWNRSTYIHKIIATVFLGNPSGAREINHKNGDKTDNNVHNLEWCSHSANMIHAFENGMMPKKRIRNKAKAA